MNQNSNITLEQFKLKQYLILSREIKQHMNKLLAHRAGVNQITLGFLDAIEEKYEVELRLYKTKIGIYSSKPRIGSITSEDIAKVKLIPINTFIKVPSYKKVICLFHSDKVPSMHIYGTTYYCFTCHAHGTTIDIVMKLFNLKFIEAVKKLL